MLEQIQALLELNFGYIFFGLGVILFVGKVLWTALEWLFVEKLKIETGKQRERRKDRERLDAVVVLANTTAENLDKLENRHNKDEEAFRKRLDKHVIDSEKDRKALDQKMEQFATNRVNDRQQSFEIQKDLINAQKEISKSVDALNERIRLNEEKQNKRVQAEIKDKIAQLYRLYNETKTIGRDELEALEDLIDTYEEHGGKNSFVHSKVQIEMYTWRVTE